MATVISKEEADASPADVLGRAWAGEEIVIEQSGAPKLRLVPVEASLATTVRRAPGSMKGQFSYTRDAFEPLTDQELKDWGL